MGQPRPIITSIHIFAVMHEAFTLPLFFLHHARLLRGRGKGYGGGFGGLMRKTEHIVPISSQMEWPLGTAPFPFLSVSHSAIFPSLFSLCRVPGRLPLFLQNCTKRTFPGCVKWGDKVVFCLPIARRRTQFFQTVFTQPGKILLVQPCSALHSSAAGKN